MYDFYSPDGYVNEDVFAYSNRAGEERGLVVYHNKFATAKGWIRISAAYSVKTESGEHMLIQKRLGEGLGLTNDGNTYCIFRDPVNDLEYIRNSKELHDQGLYIELEAYKCQVFTSFREVHDDEWHQYANLTAYLNGRGVPNMVDAMKEIFLQPIHQAYRELVNAGFFRWIISNRLLAVAGLEDNTHLAGAISQVLNEAQDKTTRLMDEVSRSTHSASNIQVIVESAYLYLQSILYLPTFQEKTPLARSRKYQQAMKYLHAGNLKISPWRNGDTYAWSVILGWALTLQLGKIISDEGYEEISRSWMDEWMLNKIFVSALNDLGLDEKSNWRAVTLVKLLTTHHGWWKMIDAIQDKKDRSASYHILTSILADSDALSYLGVNRYQDILWFNKEAFEDLLWWLFIIGAVEISALPNKDDQADEKAKNILRCYNEISSILINAQASGYKLEKFLDLVK